MHDIYKKTDDGRHKHVAVLNQGVGKSANGIFRPVLRVEPWTVAPLNDDMPSVTISGADFLTLTATRLFYRGKPVGTILVTEYDLSKIQHKNLQHIENGEVI